MTTGDFRVFVSAVSSEFGRARSAVASDLRSRELFVKVEEDFRQEGGADTMLRKLHNYIRGCAAVVCILGERSGSSPTPAEAAPFAELLPPGLTHASYTQWEFFFARHYGHRLSLFVAKGHQPENPASDFDDPALQSEFLKTIEAAGLDRQYFAIADELRWQVLRADWPHFKRPKPVVLPYSSIGKLFKGRRDFLQRLHNSLRPNAAAAIVSQALYGLGGVGKTRAAVEYALAYRGEYTALLFVVAETTEALDRNLAGLATSLLPDFDATEDAARLQAALNWLRDNPGWLLIFDNVDIPSVLARVEQLLGSLVGGHVIVTSRLANFSASFQPLPIGVLELEDAVAFLMERTDGRRRATADDEALAKEVAEELGRLALALEQAAAFVAKQRTFGQYLAEWRANREKVLAWSDPTVTGYPRSVAVTWQTSVAQLSEDGLSLLERLAWFAPEEIPEFLIEVPIPGNPSQNFHEALDDLASYSLVTRNVDAPFFLMHRLVQDVGRRSLTDEKRLLRLEEAVNWIHAAFSGDPTDVLSWSRLDPLAPHAEQVTMLAASAGLTADPTAVLLNRLARLLHAKGLFATAESMHRRALAIAEDEYDPNDRRVAVILNDLGALLLDKGHLTEAETMMRRALAIDERNYRPDHPHIAIRLNNLATLLRAQFRFEEAENLLRRALIIHEKNHGPDHPTVAAAAGNLVGVLFDTGQLEEAEPLVRGALDIAERRLGSDHPGTARQLGLLAMILQGTGRREQSGPLMRRALAINEKAYGTNHPDVAQNQSDLAQWLSDSAMYEEAEPLMRSALAGQERFHGAEHSRFADTLNNLAELLVRTKRASEAEPLVRRALGIGEKIHGTGHHPALAHPLSVLTTLLLNEKRFAEAEPFARRCALALIEYSGITGRRDPRVIPAGANYMHALEGTGKSEAEIEASVASLFAPPA